MVIFVVDFASSVNIVTIWSVVDLSRERVLRVVCDVVVCEVDDVVLMDSVFLGDLVGMA